MAGIDVTIFLLPYHKERVPLPELRPNELSLHSTLSYHSILLTSRISGVKGLLPQGDNSTLIVACAVFDLPQYLKQPPISWSTHSWHNQDGHTWRGSLPHPLATCLIRCLPNLGNCSETPVAFPESPSLVMPPNISTCLKGVVTDEGDLPPLSSPLHACGYVQWHY